MLHSIALILVLMVPACGSDPIHISDSGSDCIPGQTRQCYGPEGCIGEQVCVDITYSSCACYVTDSGIDGDADADLDSDTSDVELADGDTDNDTDTVPDGDPDDIDDADIDVEDDADEEVDSPVCEEFCWDGNPCTDDLCVDGECQYPPSSGSVCHVGADAGTCYDGECCTGCWDGSECVEGDEPTVCGGYGHTCTTCNDHDACTDDLCEPWGDTFYCTHDNLTGTECPDGVCERGRCVSCGSEDAPCCVAGSACGEWLTCIGGECEACGGAGEPACPGTTLCEEGLHYYPEYGGCYPCGGSDEYCCQSGPECGSGLSCYEGTCQCGQPGTYCCPGNRCDVGICSYGICTRT
jgi:hypothetical protein